MFAALNIYKPKGITSHDVIARLRRVYGLKRIGHLGTLDPLAEGVLPVCLGQATRLIEYFPTEKRYTAQVTLGRTTTTLDSEGEVLSEVDCTGLSLSEVRLREVLTTFTGTIMQQVPLYSAVHVAGKKLYELARKGQTAELPSREVTIHTLALLSADFENPAHPVLTLDVACSSGTYIRSLARDIGEALGCGAYMSGLVRTQHGRFNLKDSVPLEALQHAENPAQALLDPSPYLAIPVVSLDSEQQAKKLANGIKVGLESIQKSAVAVDLKPESFVLATFEDCPVGVVQISRDVLRPVKIFPKD